MDKLHYLCWASFYSAQPTAFLTQQLSLNVLKQTYEVFKTLWAGGIVFSIVSIFFPRRTGIKMYVSRNGAICISL